MSRCLVRRPESRQARGIFAVPPCLALSRSQIRLPMRSACMPWRGDRPRLVGQARGWLLVAGRKRDRGGTEALRLRVAKGHFPEAAQSAPRRQPPGESARSPRRGGRLGRAWNRGPRRAGRRNLAESGHRYQGPAGRAGARQRACRSGSPRRLRSARRHHRHLLQPAVQPRRSP